MSATDDAEAVLASVVPLGTTPTAQEIALGEAVLEEIRLRQSIAEHPSNPKEAAD